MSTRFLRSLPFAFVLLLLASAGWSAALAAPGDSRAEPVPLGEGVEAGPWRMTVAEVVVGDEANDQVAAASTFNAPPPRGAAYVLVRLDVENAGDRPLAIDGNDFALTGSSGFVRRFPGVTPPDPTLDGVVEPGEALAGWVVLVADDDERSLLLLYDSLTLTGVWADRVFALEAGAAIPDAEEPEYKTNKLGQAPDAPAAFGQRAVTEEWGVKIIEVALGRQVYDLYPAGDSRTTALGDADPATVERWIAFRVEITNVQVGGDPAFLPPTAFTLADATGNPIPDVLTLTAPSPDASGGYYPGARRRGWVAFELPTDGSAALLRFLPYRTDEDPRYLSWTDAPPVDEPAPTATGEPTPTPTTETDSPAGDGLSEGAPVIVNDDNVNLRALPSTDADVVAQFDRGTELTITGPAEEAEGYSWYPVENRATGDRGYVAGEFLDPAE